MSVKLEVSYWHDKERRRQLLVDAEDVSELYMAIGTLYGTMNCNSLEEMKHKCICIKPYLPAL